MDGAISTEQLNGLWSNIVAASGSGGGVVMLLGARDHDGVSEVASALAKMASGRVANAVWLLDLDLYANNQYRNFSAQHQLNGPFDMSFGFDPFWQLVPPTQNPMVARSAVTGYRVGQSKLFVSQFDRRTLGQGQAVKVAAAGPYWEAVRNRVDLTIVEAPPLARSRAGLALAADMDAVILVVNGEMANPDDVGELRDAVILRGGRPLGVVVTDVKRQAAGRMGNRFSGRREKPAPNAGPDNAGNQAALAARMAQRPPATGRNQKVSMDEW